jgi:hypothetical protein
MFYRKLKEDMRQVEDYLTTLKRKVDYIADALGYREHLEWGTFGPTPTRSLRVLGALYKHLGLAGFECKRTEAKEEFVPVKLETTPSRVVGGVQTTKTKKKSKK